jgi:hypothetical protein
MGKFGSLISFIACDMLHFFIVKKKKFHVVMLFLTRYGS